MRWRAVDLASFVVYDGERFDPADITVNGIPLCPRCSEVEDRLGHVCDREAV